MPHITLKHSVWLDVPGVTKEHVTIITVPRRITPGRKSMPRLSNTWRDVRGVTKGSESIPRLGSQRKSKKSSAATLSRKVVTKAKAQR